MKILFIEADKWLDDKQEEFVNKLLSDGQMVSIITDCYDNISQLKGNLSTFKPDIICVQTTFVYESKFKAFEKLYELIDYPIELWYMGACSGTRLTNYMPPEFLKNVTIFDIWADVYGEKITGYKFKTLVYPTS